MPQSSLNSFFRFTIGFLLFISLSFGITFAVDRYTRVQEQERQTAAALKALIQQGR